MTATDTNPAPLNTRRAACILIAAADGDVRAARGLVGRAIRSALSVTRWGDADHGVSYYSSAACDGGLPRFTLEVTDAEMDALTAEIEAMAAAEGWTAAPVDIYHD